jgi:hypothetical protein
MMAVYIRGFIGGVAAAMVYLLTEVIRAVGLQTDLHDPVHRAWGLHKQDHQTSISTTSTPPKSKRLAAALGTADLLQNAPGSVGGNGETFPLFTQHAERPPPKSTGAVVVDEAEDGERVDHVGHKSYGKHGLLCLCPLPTLNAIQLFAWLPGWELKECELHVIEALLSSLTIKQDRRPCHPRRTSSNQNRQDAG